ncbi:MAG: sulfur carrier protein ThiS [Planctomycetes bacterium]|nr:sulfur carrier protein ThiS [Planctomycetota bacterium]
MHLTLNGETREFDAGLSLLDLLARIGVTPEGVAVELNLEVVPRARLAQVRLQEGDAVEVVSFVGGG